MHHVNYALRPRAPRLFRGSNADIKMNPPERFIEAYTMSANSAGRSNERRTVTPVKGRAGLIATPDGTCTVPLASAIPTPPMVVLLASLALGGAERIVVEWLRAESLRRPIKLVVLHDQPRELRVPPAVTLIRLHGTNLAERLAVFAQN